MNLLLCTLGMSWAVIPESYAFLAPESLPLFQHHPDAASLERERTQHGLVRPDEVWIATTDSPRTLPQLEPLAEWWKRIDRPGELRVWRAAGTDQLASAGECGRFRELVFRLCLLASESTGAEGRLFLSLAGGRKTMSADLQRAGSLFGCHALLHVIDGGIVGTALEKPTSELMSKTLPRDTIALPERAAVTPLVVGRSDPNEALFVDLQDEPSMTTCAFPIPLAPPLRAPGGALVWQHTGTELTDSIARREAQGVALFGNYLRGIGERERHESWRSLYRLPLRTIEWLRNTPVDASHAELLQRIPKADLHCHLGGILDIAAQRRVAQAAWPLLDASRRAAALDRMARFIRDPSRWPDGWLSVTKEGDRPANAMALLMEVDDSHLVASLFGPTEPRIGLLRRAPFAAYERPGDLSGSALLSEPAAVDAYVREACASAIAQGLRYVEWRCSPQKYDRTNPIRCLRALRDALRRAAAGAAGLDARLIVVVNRTHPLDDIARAIDVAVAARRELGDLVVAVDVAGDERVQSPEDLAPHFDPIFRECLSITIHAGEGEAAEAIWDAAYRLHADRIGHGLTLGDHSALAARFRDRDICLELCPTSNMEVVGYRDPAESASSEWPEYPLRRLLDAGVPLTLCTDNPGISRCMLAGEYVRASRMVGGISLWEALALIKQGFAHAFAPAAVRERLLKEADARVFEIAGGDAHGRL